MLVTCARRGLGCVVESMDSLYKPELGHVVCVRGRGGVYVVVGVRSRAKTAELLGTTGSLDSEISWNILTRLPELARIAFAFEDGRDHRGEMIGFIGNLPTKGDRISTRRPGFYSRVQWIDKSEDALGALYLIRCTTPEFSAS